MVDRVTRKNQDLVSELPLTISAQYGLIDQNEFFDKRVASKDVSGYYLIENGEFAYNKSTSTDAPWGAVKRLDRYENGVLSTLYIVFGIKENNLVDSDFLVSYYSTNLWHKGIHEIAAEGARNHGLLNIAPADFFETELTMPQDIEEQKKIGKYFEELERLITLHQRKNIYFYEKVTLVWEQRKFGDLGSVAMCKRIFKEQTSTDGDIPFYKIGTFGAEPDAFISRELFEEYRGKFQYPNIGDMLISASGTIGRTVEYKGEEAYFQDSNIVWFKHDDRVDNSFLKCIYEIVKWSGIEGSTIKRLYNDNFLKTEFSMPKVAEQQQIGMYFQSLDHLITLHQRKCEETKKLKKYMLQKMFPQNGRTVPEIRFAGFTDAWEQRKLGKLVDRVTRKNQDLVSELPLTISAQYGLIDQNEFFDKRVASKDVSGYYLIENGEFAYNKSTSTDAPWGAVKRLDRYENGVLSTLYIVFGIKENNLVDSDFLVSYYSTNLWHKGIHEIAAEGARNHGLLNIAPADFFETELTMPQDIEEQKKIGKYFEELERLITLHQRKNIYFYEKVTLVWEQRKFGDLGSVAMCKRIFKEQTSTDGDIPFYKIGTFGAEPDAFISRELFEEYRGKFQYPNIGDMLISASGTIGRTVEYKGEEAYFQDSNIVWFKHDDRVDNSFLKCIYEIVKWSGIEGSTIKRLYNDNFLKTEFSMPKVAEQQQIGMYFQSLDHLITLHQCKCHLLLKLLHNDWEQRKLGDLVGIYDGVHQTPDYQDSGIMFLSVENIATLKSEKYISEEAFERDYNVYPEKGDILMTRIGDVGTTNVVETAEKVAFYVSLALLKPNGIDSYFLSNAMKTNDFQKGLRERTLVTAIPQKINKDEIGKINIFITNNDEEQKKIGAYFSSLDHLITLHHRKYIYILKSP